MTVFIYSYCFSFIFHVKRRKNPPVPKLIGKSEQFNEISFEGRQYQLMQLGSSIVNVSYIALVSKSQTCSIGWGGMGEEVSSKQKISFDLI